jgi:hypothetical protein
MVPSLQGQKQHRVSIFFDLCGVLMKLCRKQHCQPQQWWSQVCMCMRVRWWQ